MKYIIDDFGYVVFILIPSYFKAHHNKSGKEWIEYDLDAAIDWLKAMEIKKAAKEC